MESRPTEFDGIIGHEAVIEGLTGAFERDRVAHAYLFAGPDGIGKRRVAMAFLTLVCAGDDPKRAARVARAFAAENHPDLVKLEADGASIKIAQVREATRSLRFPPVEAASRAILIDRAELMREAAANALLKTLEEPSAKNIFVLLTSQPNALLATVRSRCQQVRFTALPRERVAQWLTSEKDVDADTADELAGLSEGSLGAAESLLDPTVAALRDTWLDVLVKLPTASPIELLEFAEAMGASKASVPAVIDVLRVGLRDVMLRSAGVAEDQLTFRRRASSFPVVSRRAAVTALDSLAEAETAFYGNVNPRMIGEHLLLGLRRALSNPA
ncbi:MAG: DNA polymerase-3 subunit delta' [Myxococcota bacterium]|jgi:DNA polymerase-3 subunit delta'